MYVSRFLRFISVIVKIPVIQSFWAENASQYVENLSIGEKSEDVLSKSYFLIKQDNTLYEFYIIKKVFRI